jgi:Ca-activated chloride channel family protein
MDTVSRRHRLRDLFVVAVLLCGWRVAAQTPVYRAAIDLVPLVTTVRDASGHLVTTLSRDDFEVLDEGRSAPITLFTSDPQPADIVVLVDVSGNVIDPPVYQGLRLVLNSIVDAIGPGDRLRFGTFAGREIALSARFTSDRDEARRVVREEIWPGFFARPLWRGLEVAVSALATEPRRRVVLLVTRGPDGASAHGSSKRAANLAQQADCMIYAVALGRFPMGVSTRESSEDNTMEAVASAATRTGGGFVVAPPGSNLIDVLRDVVDEIRHQYVIGITPATHDGKRHRLQVRAKPPGLTVRARTDYVPGGAGR